MKKLIAGINLFVGVNEVILKGSSMYLFVLKALCFLWKRGNEETSRSLPSHDIQSER